MKAPRPHRRSALVVLASLLAVALVPGSAFAARTVYGGDVHGARGGPFALQLEPGDALEVGLIAFDASLSCPGYSTGLAIGDALPLVSPRIRLQSNGLYSRPVGADGTWDASGFVAYGFGRHEVEIDETFTGKVVGATMSGTFRAKAKVYGPNDRLVSKCRIARRRWTAQSRPGRIFGGATQQNMPMVVEVANDGATIRRARVSGWASCGKGDLSAPTLSNWRGILIDPAGGFEGSMPYTYRDSGFHYRGRDAIKGRIDGTVVRGTVSGHWTERRLGRKKTLKCASGAIRYRVLSSPLP